MVEIKESQDIEDFPESDEENVPHSKLTFWHINVHILDKKMYISVGDATQRIKWLAQVAIARWDTDNNQGWKRLGIPTTVRHQRLNGNELDMNAIIRDVLRDGDHIFIESSLKPMETR